MAKNPVNRGRRIAEMGDAYLNNLRERIVNNSVRIPIDYWFWMRNHQRNGYGSARAFGRVMPAHRASYLAFKGPIPGDKEIGHTCHERACVNPEHLEAITHAQNMKDRNRRKQWQAI